MLIVDDHAGFRAAARAMLEQAGWEVVGEAGDGACAVTEARRLAPSLVLLDVGLPDIDGYEVADRLDAAQCDSAIILVSVRSPRGTARPTRAFLPKSELTPEALRAMLDGLR